MTTILYAICVWLAWTPATGQVDGYDLYLDGTFWGTVGEETVEVCVADLGFGYYQQHDIYVVAVNSQEEGPRSGSLHVEWHWNFDFDQNDVIGFNDFGGFVAAFGLPAGATDFDFDASQDGVVGFADFALFAREFGKCSDGRIQIPCT